MKELVDLIFSLVDKKLLSMKIDNNYIKLTPNKIPVVVTDKGDVKLVDNEYNRNKLVEVAEYLRQHGK